MGVGGASDGYLLRSVAKQNTVHREIIRLSSGAYNLEALPPQQRTKQKLLLSIYFFHGIICFSKEVVLTVAVDVN